MPLQDKRAASLSDRSTALKGSGSSVHSIPDISSRESQLDSAGALLGNRLHSSRSPVMEEDEDVDSDLMPGDESEVEITREDVTRRYAPPETTPGIRDDGPVLRMRREVSFDIDIVGEEVAVGRSETDPAQKRPTQPHQDRNGVKPTSAGSGRGQEGGKKAQGEKVDGKYTPLTRRLNANMVSMD